MVAKLIAVTGFLLLIALVYIYITDYKNYKTKLLVYIYIVINKHLKSRLLETIRSNLLQYTKTVSLNNLDQIILSIQKDLVQAVPNHEALKDRYDVYLKENLDITIKEADNLRSLNKNVTKDEYIKINRKISDFNLLMKSMTLKLKRLNREKEKFSIKHGFYIFTDCVLFSKQFLKSFYNNSLLYTSDEKWLIYEGDYVNKDQPIFTFKISNEAGYRNILVKSPLSGYIGIFSVFYSTFDPIEQMFFGLYDDDSVRLAQRYQHVSNVEIDPFTNIKRLHWKQVGLPSDSFISLYKLNSGSYNNTSYLSSILEPGFVNVTGYLMFAVENIDSKDYLKIEFLRKELRLSTNDIIFFRFSDNTLLEFKLTGKCYTSSIAGMQGFKVQIYNEEVEIFSKCSLDGIRIYSVKEEYKLDFESANFWYTAKKDFQFVVKTLFSQYLNEVNSHIEDYKPLSRSTNVEANTIGDLSTCYVYLMNDTINNYCKIGISTNPQFREKTLQSEKPTIELICSKEYPSRKIAESIEKALHNTFRAKHIRGEWFSLDQKDIEQIKLTLK